MEKGMTEAELEEHLDTITASFVGYSLATMYQSLSIECHKLGFLDKAQEYGRLTTKRATTFSSGDPMGR